MSNYYLEDIYKERVYVSRDFEVIPYFKAKELACQGTGLVKLDRYLQIYLPFLREQWGKPLIITSGCRSPEHNTAIGGHPNSFHLTDNPKYNTTGCAAVDISWRGWSDEDKEDFVLLVKDEGWNYGTADTFIHIDRGMDHGKPFTTWTY